MRQICAVFCAAFAIYGCGGNGGGALASIAISGPSSSAGQGITLTSLGATAQLAAVASDGKGAAIPGALFSWSSSNAAVASVVASSGLVTAVGNGDASIQASSSGILATLAVHVAQQIATIAVAPSGQSLERGTTLQLSASATDANANPIAGVQFVWSSGAPSIATVASGLVSGVGIGTASISASSGSQSGTASVVVTVPAIAGVSIVETSPPPLGALGATLQLHGLAQDVRGAAIPEAQLVWNTDAQGVATVDANGLVTAVGNGTANISVSAGGFSAALGVTVEQLVAQIAVAPAAQSLERGATLQLSASAVDANDNPVVNAPLDWTSDASSIASVTTGLVLGVSVGSTTVRAAAGGQSGSASITVTIPAVASVQIEETAPAPLSYLGATLQLHGQALDARGAGIPEALLAWSSSATSVATVNNSGLVVAVADGQSTITASAGGKSAQLAVTVSQAVAQVAVSTPAGASAQLTAFGATLQLTAQATDASGRPLGGFQFVWTSGDPTVATVDAQSGLVTALHNGSTSIRAELDGFSGSATVTVQQQANTTAVLPQNASIERGATQTFTAAASDENGNPVSGLVPVWSVDSGGIASIDQNGIATGEIVGATNVHALMGGHTGDAPLSVVVPGVAAVTIAETAPATLDHFGATLQLHATATDARGAAIPEAQIAWSSGTPGVATIDAQSGLVTAVADGQAIIAAAAGGRSSTLNVTVAQTVATLSVAPHGGAAAAIGAFGATLQLDATARDSGGAAIGGVSFTWAICDGAAITNGCTNGVASISSSGLVTALANGSALVSASAGGQSGTLAVSIAQTIAQVAVTPSSDTIGNGDTRQFSASAFDANAHPIASTPAPAWSSSDTSLATIDSTGLATATTGVLAQADSTQITATITDGSGAHSGVATLTVDPAVHAAASVTVTPSGGTGLFTAAGQTLSVTAAAFDRSNSPISNLSFSWSSSDGTVAQVAPSAAGSATATITAIGDGAATITASAGGKDGTLAVSVDQQIASLSAGSAPTTLASFTATLQLSALDSNSQSIGSGVTWTSCDGTASPPCIAATIASVSNSGLVTALKNGSARISAQTVLAGAPSAAQLDILVAQQVAQVSAQTSTALPSIGATVQLSALDAKGVAVDPSGLTWSSSDSTIATVSNQGLVTAVANGAVNIKAQGPNDGGKSIGVTVAQVVTSVATAVSGAATMLTYLNQTVQLDAFDALDNLVVDATFTSCDGAVSPPCAAATVATLSGTGLATAKANGQARITAKRGSEAGASIDLAVAQQVSSVLPATAALVSLGATQQLTAFDSGGSAIASGVTWTACDGTSAPPGCVSSVASVSSTGLATALTNGSARITASTTLASTTSQAHGDLAVAQSIAQLAPGVQGASTTLTAFGQTLQLAALDANGHAFARAITWQSDAEAIASIDTNGVVTAVADGTAHITAQGPDASQAELDIQVDQRVAQVRASGASTTLTALGNTLQLEALDARGNNVASASWSSDTTAHATVNGTGSVTAIANGEAAITAFTSGDAGAQLGVTVAQTPSILSPATPATLTSLLTGAGSSVQLSALDANGNSIPSGLTWTACDNNNVPPCAAATIVHVTSAGLVTAQKNGSARITAANGSVTASVSIAVQQSVSSVAISPVSASIGIGSTQAFTATAKDAGGNALTGTTASWTSGGASIATIDASSGIATGVAAGGPITITGTIGGISGTAQLTVTSALFGLTINNYEAWCSVTATVGSTTLASFSGSSATISPKQTSGTVITLTSSPLPEFITGHWEAATGLTTTTAGNATYTVGTGTSQSISVCCPFPNGTGCPF